MCWYGSVNLKNRNRLQGIVRVCGKIVGTTLNDLNSLYKNNPALYEKQFTAEGFEWINYSDHQNSVLT